MQNCNTFGLVQNNPFICSMCPPINILEVKEKEENENLPPIPFGICAAEASTGLCFIFGFTEHISDIMVLLS